MSLKNVVISIKNVLDLEVICRMGSGNTQNTASTMYACMEGQ